MPGSSDQPIQHGGGVTFERYCRSGSFVTMHHRRARTQTQPQHPRTVAARRPCPRTRSRLAYTNSSGPWWNARSPGSPVTTEKSATETHQKRSLAHHSGPDPHRHQLGRRLTTVAFTAVRSAARGAPTLTPLISRLLAGPRAYWETEPTRARQGQLPQRRSGHEPCSPRWGHWKSNPPATQKSAFEQPDTDRPRRTTRACLINGRVQMVMACRTTAAR